MSVEFRFFHILFLIFIVIPSSGYYHLFTNKESATQLALENFPGGKLISIEIWARLSTPKPGEWAKLYKQKGISVIRMNLLYNSNNPYDNKQLQSYRIFAFSGQVIVSAGNKWQLLCKTHLILWSQTCQVPWQNNILKFPNHLQKTSTDQNV